MMSVDNLQSSGTPLEDALKKEKERPEETCSRDVSAASANGIAQETWKF